MNSALRLSRKNCKLRDYSYLIIQTLPWKKNIAALFLLPKHPSAACEAPEFVGNVEDFMDWKNFVPDVYSLRQIFLR